MLLNELYHSHVIIEQITKTQAQKFKSYPNE